MGIGQVVLGVCDLDAARRRFEALGFLVLDGGVHPGLGTANRVIPLGDSYLELLGIVDGDMAATTRFGQSLAARIAGGDRLVRWSIRTDGIDRVGARLGLAPETRRRKRPDGKTLKWRAAGLDLALELAWLPFFVQWDDDARFPGRFPPGHHGGHPAAGYGIRWLQVSTPDPDRLARWVDGERVPLRLASPRDGIGAIDAVAISTPDGDVVVDGDGTASRAT
jgi:hypothetical protein